MVQVDGSPYGLEEGLVRPPDADALWEWYVRTGRDERDPDPSWGDVWDSARHLAAYVKRGGGDITGERVVELGCGLGVVGIAAAKAGASAVVLVDREPECLHCALATASLNGCTVGVDGDEGVVVSAAVGTFASASTSISRADVVLGSDVIYDSSHMRDLAAACRCLAPRALISDPAAGRARGAREAFVNAVTEMGGVVQQTPLEETRDAEDTILLTIEWAT